MVKGEYVLLVPSILGISKKENSPGKKSHLLTLLKKKQQHILWKRKIIFPKLPMEGDLMLDI